MASLETSEIRSVAREHASALPRAISVLVIDDDPDTHDLLQLLLQGEGYSVVTAAHGSEALDLLQTIRPELILLDIQMPIMDGHEFREAQRRNRDLIRIPTVVMTGSTYEPMLDLAVEETLVKPIRRAQLLEVVARYCHGRPAGDGR